MSEETKIVADLEPEPQALETRPQLVRPVQSPGGQSALAAEALAIVRHSAEIGALFGALSKAQGAFGNVEKTLKAKVQSRREGATSYEYLYETLDDVLEAVRPSLSANGIALMQFPFTRSGSLTLRTMLGHESGQWLTNDLVAAISGTDPQSVGSGISYLRRYAVKAILGIAPGIDDDGAAASGQKPAPIQPAQRKSQTEPAEPKAEKPNVERSNVGIIVEIGEKDGVLAARLDSGFRCATRDKNLSPALLAAKKAGATVELRCKPQTDPKYMPTLVDVLTVIDRLK